MESPGIFLSYNHADKSFVRQLASDLQASGARVWVDEGEIRLGDSLIQKISQGLEAMDYVAVVLSPESVASSWVQKELEVAMAREINGRRIRVLPLLYRDCSMPSFLRDKLYADFRHPHGYSAGLALVLQRLDIDERLRRFPEAPVREMAGREVYPILWLKLASNLGKKRTPHKGTATAIYWLIAVSVIALAIAYRTQTGRLFNLNSSAIFGCSVAAAIFLSGLLHIRFRKSALSPDDWVAYWFGFVGSMSAFLSALFEGLDLTVFQLGDKVLGGFVGIFIGFGAGVSKVRRKALAGSAMTRLFFAFSVALMCSVAMALAFNEVVGSEGQLSGLVAGFSGGSLAGWLLVRQSGDRSSQEQKNNSSVEREELVE